MRSIGIWLTTIIVWTLGSAAIVAVPLWNTNSHNCMMPGNSIAYILGIVFGFFGLQIGLRLAPAAVKSDPRCRDYWMRAEEREKQAQSKALSLLRAAECPPIQARDELLRPAQTGNTTAPDQLLKAADTHGLFSLRETRGKAEDQVSNKDT